MNTDKVQVSLTKTAAGIIAAVFAICYMALFIIPSGRANADVGQPDIPVPALPIVFMTRQRVI